MKTPISALLAKKGTIVHSVCITATAQAAVDVMNEKRVGCIVVRDGDRLAGVFTERDVLTRIVAAGKDPRTTPVTEVMSDQPLIVAPELTIDKAMALISEKRMRHLPIVEDGRLLGLVSIGDINQWMVENLRFEAESLRSYVSDNYPG